MILGMTRGKQAFPVDNLRISPSPVDSAPPLKQSNPAKDEAAEAVARR
jgi:hypothetical protein